MRTLSLLRLRREKISHLKNYLKQFQCERDPTRLDALDSPVGSRAGLNARALPPKLDAGELMSLLRGNPRYMLSPVDACLWRQRCGRISGKYAVAGFREYERQKP